MDRLVNPNVKEIELIFKRGEEGCKSFRLTNLMHTMAVAVSLSTSNSALFTFKKCLSIIPPLSSATYDLISFPSDNPSVSFPADYVSVQSLILPTGKAHDSDLRRLFSQPGNHVFRDATIPISFVGFEVIEFFIPRSTQVADIDHLLTKSIPWCDKSQLTKLLSSAILCSDTKTVFALIHAGADVNYRDRDGKCLVSIAIQAGSEEILKGVLARYYAGDDYDDLFLHEAANINRVDLMEVLLREIEDIDINRGDPRGRTPIHVGAANGSVEVILFCVAAGGRLNVVDVNGWTPLHCAAENGHMGVVEFLLECPNFDARTVLTKDGRTASGIAMENGHKHLHAALQLGDELQRAARVGDVTALKSCLSRGVKVNIEDQNGWTPLHRAAFKGRVECVRLLLSHGADFDSVDSAGYTPLQYAIEVGHVQVAMVLLAHGGERGNVKGLNRKRYMPVNQQAIENLPTLIQSQLKLYEQ